VPPDREWAGARSRQAQRCEVGSLRCKCVVLSLSGARLQKEREEVRAHGH